MNKLFKYCLFIFMISFVGIISVFAADSITATNITIKEKSSTISVDSPIISNNNISTSITFNNKDDYVIFEVTLKNNCS